MHFAVMSYANTHPYIIRSDIKCNRWAEPLNEPIISVATASTNNPATDTLVYPIYEVKRCEQLRFFFRD
jgi:hypothetical protein